MRAGMRAGVRACRTMLVWEIHPAHAMHDALAGACTSTMARASEKLKTGARRPAWTCSRTVVSAPAFGSALSFHRAGPSGADFASVVHHWSAALDVNSVRGVSRRSGATRKPPQGGVSGQGKPGRHRSWQRQGEREFQLCNNPSHAPGTSTPEPEPELKRPRTECRVNQ